MHKAPVQRLRKRNSMKIAQAFSQVCDLPIWVGWVDPLSKQSLHTRVRKPHINHVRQYKQFGHHTFFVKGRLVHVPLEMYWREIADWEIQGLVMEWRLTEA